MRVVDLVEWDRSPEVASSDRPDILELANIVGLSEVRKVSGVWPLPVGTFFLLAESERVVDGHVVTWRTLDICRVEDALRCSDRAGGPMFRAGRWMTSRAMLDTEQRFRIRDAEWFLDVSAPELTFEAAERIVVAVRRAELLDRLPRTGNAAVDRVLYPGIPPLKVDDLTTINRVEGSSYRVSFGRGGAGTFLTVRITEEGVEVLAIGTWIV